MLIKFILISICLFGSLSALGQANELKSTEAQILADDLKREISSTLAEIDRLEKQQNPDTNSLSIVLSQPAYNVINFGVVIDPDVNTVLSVTPYSNAESLGLKAGDVIARLSIDGTVVTSLSEGLQLKPGSLIEAQVKRGDNSLTLDTIAHSKTIPAWRLQVSANDSAQKEPELTGCGYISVFFSPPTTKYQYPAKVFEVDGESGFHLRETIKLPSGTHSLKIHEYIPDSMMSRRKPSIEKAKELELIVKPNKTYHIAAQFDPEKRLKVVDEDYWKPIVWKVSDSKCKP